jgi:hypothetical protein
MTKKQLKQYKPVEELRQYLALLDKEKFVLDCGHHITFGEFLGNSIVINNGKKLKIVCVDCGS